MTCLHIYQLLESGLCATDQGAESGLCATDHGGVLMYMPLLCLLTNNFTEVDCDLLLEKVTKTNNYLKVVCVPQNTENLRRCCVF